MKGNLKKFFALMLAGCMFLTACGSDAEAPAESSGETSESVGSEGGEAESGSSGEEASSKPSATTSKDTLVIGVGGTISNLDGKEGVVNQSKNVYTVVGESLLKEVKAEDGTPILTTEGSITESYEADEENSAIIFHLKENVAMQDGTVLNADDVVASIMHLQDGTFYTDIDYDNVKAIDEYTVSIGVPILGQPIINKVAAVPIWSKEAYDACGNEGVFFTDGYVSCGQYKITEWVAGDSVTVEAFEDYYGGQPLIKKVIYRIFSEPSVAMMELQTGGVDYLTDPDYQSYLDVNDGKYGDALTAEASEGNMLYAIYLNMNSEKLQDYRVRQAIMYCLDRKAISDNAFNGYGMLSFRILGMTYGGMTTYTEADWPYEQDIEKAKELMAEAGYADGMELNLISHNAGAYYSKLGEAFQNQVKEIGITVNTQVYEPAVFKQTQNGLEGWDVSTTSPNTAYMTNAGEFKNNALISSMHCDARPTEGYDKAEEICDALRSATTDEEIATLTKQFEEEYFNSWLWWYPIQLSGTYTLQSAQLHGVYRCLNTLDLGDAYFE